MNAIKKHNRHFAPVADSGAQVPRTPVDHRSVTKHAANDTLYDELEMRYGGAFAQWLIDDLARSKSRAAR